MNKALGPKCQNLDTKGVKQTIKSVMRKILTKFTSKLQFYVSPLRPLKIWREEMMDFHGLDAVSY